MAENIPKPKPKSNQPCWKFQEGKCTFGNKCKWSHEVQEGARGEFRNASAKEKGEGKKEKFMSLMAEVFGEED